MENDVISLNERINELSQEYEKAINYIEDIKKDYPSLERDNYERKVEVVEKSENFDKEMENEAINTAIEGIKLNNGIPGVAYYIKNEFDSKYEPMWECIIGYDYYGSLEAEKYIIFLIGKKQILLFRNPK